MKLKLLALLTFFFLALIFLPHSPAAAQDQPKIIVNQPSYVWVIFIEKTVDCGGSLSLTSPSEQHLFDYQDDPVIKKIGPLAAGSELTFSLTPTPPCSTETLFSENPNHAYIEKDPQQDAWAIVWLLNQQTEVVVTVVGLQQITAPSYHPVIFIHGLGGRPEDWTTGDKRVYIDTLKSEPYNYPENYLMTYAYADADGNPDTYDYQGDVTKISDDLGDYVNELSARHLSDGGDGKVDIVGFSLGGLVARQYLNENPDNHRVRRLITIASPHEGSYVLAPNTWFEKIPLIGIYVRRAINAVFNFFLAIPGREHGQLVDLNSPAAQQIVPGSSYLGGLNDLNIIPTDPNYSTLYGSIDAELSQKLFFFEFKKRFSIGDGLILEDSAVGIPVDGLETYGVSDEEIYKMQIRVVDSPSGEYEYVLDTPSIEDYRVWHGRLIVHPDIVQKVVETLTN